MSLAKQWLDAYAETTAAGTRSRALDWVTIPLLVLGLIGLLWSLPVPAAFQASAPTLNWGTLFLMAALVYYFILSITLAFGALPFVVAVVAVLAWLDTKPIDLPALAATTFAAAFAAQLVRRRLSGRAVNPLRDLQFLMLGPLWLVALLFRRLEIPY
jgi:hypothetical protein